MADPWLDMSKRRVTTESGADAERPQRLRVPSRIAMWVSPTDTQLTQTLLRLW